MPVVERPKGRKRIAIVGISILVLVVIAAAVGFAIFQRNMSEQKLLQAELTNPLSTNYAQTASAATQLIDGKLQGKYHFSNKLLAGYYLQGATAYYNLKDYSKAITYYQAAPKYDSSLKMAALQGQVSAGYAKGERQQLIPLLQQLVDMSKNSHSLLGPSSVQYQADIQALQNNQPVDL